MYLPAGMLSLDILFHTRVYKQNNQKTRWLGQLSGAKGKGTVMGEGKAEYLGQPKKFFGSVEECNGTIFIDILFSVTVCVSWWKVQMQAEYDKKFLF